MSLQDYQKDMNLLTRLWDDFALDCKQHGMKPEWKLFMLWIGGISTSAKKIVMHVINEPDGNDESTHTSPPGASPMFRAA